MKIFSKHASFVSRFQDRVNHSTFLVSIFSVPNLDDINMKSENPFSDLIKNARPIFFLFRFYRRTFDGLILT